MGIDVEEELSRSGEKSLSRTMFRYEGSSLLIKAIMRPESYRDYVVNVSPTLDDNVFTEDLAFLNGTSSSGRNYIDEEYTYRSSDKRLESRTVRNAAGSCGCSGSSAGVFWYSYVFAAGTPNLNTWYEEVSVKKGAVESSATQYAYFVYNTYGKKLVEVMVDPDNSSREQVHKWEYDTSTGALVAEYLPSACSSFNHTDRSVTLETSDGLIYSYTITDNGATYVVDSFFKEVGDTSPVQLSRQTLTKRIDTGGTGKRKRYLLTSHREYIDASTSVETKVDVDEYYSSSQDVLAPKRVKTTLPTVITDHNGSGSTTAVSRAYKDVVGRVLWTKDASGAVNYTEYFTYAPQVKRRIVDVNTTTLGPPHTDFNQGYTRSTSWPDGGSPQHMETTYSIEENGRVQKITDPEGRTRRFQATLLLHGELVQLEFPHLTTSAGTGGALSISVSYQGGGVRDTAVATLPSSVHANDSSQDSSYWLNLWNGSYSNIVDALPTGATVTSHTAYIHENGHLMATRRFIDASTPVQTNNVLETTYEYDDRGNRNKVTDPSGTGGGTITKSTFDFLRRLVSVEVGTSDVQGSSNMVEVEARAYDGVAIGSTSLGDGKLTKVVRKPGGSASNRETLFEYDYAQEGRLVKTTSPSGIIEKRTYDRRGNVIDVKVYGTGGDSDEENRRVWRQYSYDSRGQLFEEKTNAVDPTYGTTWSTAYALTKYWRSERGDLMKVLANGYVLRKSQFDGAGRLVRSTVSHDSSETSWTASVDLALGSDTVIEQSETLYDKSGNAIIQKRLDRAVGYGSTGLLVHGNASAARGNYTASWYDMEGRKAAEGFYGDHGNADLTLSDITSQPSASSSSVLLSKWTYYEDGDVKTMTDPQGIVTSYLYDDLGRMIKKTENDTGTGPWSDRVTDYAYTVTDQIETIQATTAGATGSTPQATTYTYGVTAANGSAVTSNRLVYQIEYPQEDNSVEKDTFGYNALGDVVKKTDVAGIVHDYLYTVEGSPSADKVTLPVSSGFDDGVLAIGRTYDDLGRLEKVTSYSDAGMTTAVNEVKHSYEKYGLPSVLTQNPEGTAGSGNSSKTITNTYTYPTSGSGPLRKTSVTYPSGLVVNELYGTTGYDNDRLSRLYGRQSSTGSITLFQNTYQGIGRVRTRSHPQPQVDWKINSEDRFGRISQLSVIYTPYTYYQNNYQYGYNYNSQVTYRKELTTSEQSEAYAYNGLSMLKLHQRGIHAGDGSIATVKASQEWLNETSPSLDHSGNWRNYKIPEISGTEFTRQVNKSNEVLEIDPPIGPTEQIAYDANGNATTTTYSDRTFVYDAWNRLVKVIDGTTVVLQFSYNGLNRKVTKKIDTPQGLTLVKRYYYNENWQVLQEFDGAATPVALFSFVWGTQYIDELVARRTESSGSWEYFMQDANFNVITRISSGGSVTHRYRYAAYGVPLQLNSSWTTITTITEDLHLFTGQEYHEDVGIYDYRNRAYHPTWGRFLQRDPIGIWGDASGFGSSYPISGCSPLSFVDPHGLFSKEVHEQVTRDGLSLSGLGEKCLQAVIKGNVDQDKGALTNSGAFADPDNHGDNGRIAETIAKIKARLDALSQITCECPSGPDSKECKKLRESILGEFGKALHAMQDLYSHSNYIEITDQSMGGARPGGTIPLWDFWKSDGTPNVPSGVTSGNYQWPSDNGPSPSHKEMAKDSLDYPAGKKRNGSGDTYHYLATEAARQHTAKMWNDFVGSMKNNDCFKAFMSCCCKKS